MNIKNTKRSIKMAKLKKETKRVQLNLSTELYEYCKEQADNVGTAVSSFIAMTMNTHREGIEASKTAHEFMKKFEELAKKTS
jgi:hypothetical protein